MAIIDREQIQHLLNDIKAQPFWFRYIIFAGIGALTLAVFIFLLIVGTYLTTLIEAWIWVLCGGVIFIGYLICIAIESALFFLKIKDTKK